MPAGFRKAAPRRREQGSKLNCGFFAVALSPEAGAFDVPEIRAFHLDDPAHLVQPGTHPLADGFQERVPQSYVEKRIEELVRPPAVVLFGVSPDLWTEMAYNTDVAWPDDAPIVRAHDLGARDAELVDYYGQLQPERMICQFDWGRGSIRFLGKAGELRRRLFGTPPNPRPGSP